VKTLHDRAYLALDRLERAYQRAGTPHRFAELCVRLIDANPQDWRTRLALSRHHAAGGRHRKAFELLSAALPHNPHGLAIHQEVWKALLALDLDPALVRSYMELTRSAVFYLDPHVCVHCRYRSTELLWQCPQCHEWNTFVEERMSTAKDTVAAVDG
jgi:lipopolysaccharide biosynthesis regulator YciM